MTGHYAYLLAATRRDPYYIDIAPTLNDVRRTSRNFMQARCELTGCELWDPALLVWHAACESEAAARDRVAGIRAWPHRWQRRLVEIHNPYWLDQHMLLEGWPPEHWYVIPETVPATGPLFGPHGVPPEVVAQMKAQYNSAVFTR